MSQLSPTARAILLMIAAILCFTLMDATAKALAPRVGVVQALWTRYAGQALVVFILVARTVAVPALHTLFDVGFKRLRIF